MNLKTKHQLIFAEALSYLAQRASMDSIRRHMVAPASAASAGMADVFEQLLSSLANRQAMANTIGDIGRLRTILRGFEPADVLSSYDSWGQLFDAVKASGKAPGRMDKDNPRSYWVHFCKGTLDAAKFLTGLGSVEKFRNYVGVFYSNDETKADLPQLIAGRIHGMGFPLACDFLKELGYTDYAKPDVHIKAVLGGFGLTDGSDRDTLRAVVLMAKSVGETPYAVDKVLWLIGSGNLYLDNIRFKTDRAEFMKQATSALER